MVDPYFSFNAAAFRVTYPAFANETTFPTVTLQAYFTTAGSYLANDNYGQLRDDSRYTALTLMTAHLAALSVLIAAGETPSVAAGASIDKVTVSLEPPPVKSQFHWWLSTTPYGQQLLAMLQMRSAGGFYLGGSRTRGGFRGNAGYGI